jgi:hypothetical protein
MGWSGSSTKIKHAKYRYNQLRREQMHSGAAFGVRASRARIDLNIFSMDRE